MKNFLPAILLSGCCSIATAQDPVPDPGPLPAPTPEPISIRLVLPYTPPAPVIPADPIPPAPKPVETLKAGEFLIVATNVAVDILTSPDGHCEVVQRKEGTLFFTKLAGGNGVEEEKTFPEPYVYTIRGISAATVELIVIPEGPHTKADILRQMLLVMGGGPQPPPKPEPDPGPFPKPMPEPTASSVHVVIVEDSQNRTPATAILLNALVGWNEFIEAGNSYRLYDRSTTEPKGIRDAGLAAAAGKPLPIIIVRDAATWRVIHTEQLPKTFAEFKTLIGALTGG